MYQELTQSNTHAYLTKVPYGAITPFIEAFSRPGDTIADIFAGSGMTGIAAIMSGRNAIVSDISVLGQHIGTGLSTLINESEFQKVADEVIKKAKENVGLIYKTKRLSDKKELELIRTIWSFIYECPGCKNELVYFEEIDENGGTPKSCTHCHSPFVKRSWKRVGEKPVRVVVAGSNGKQVEQKISALDLKRIKQAAKALKPGGHMSVVFGNSSGPTWAIVQNALRESGFLSNPVHVAILDKGQKSVKGLSSGKEIIATVDLVITVQKPMNNIELKNTKSLIKADLEYLIKSAIKNIKSQEKINPSYLYASILMEAFRNNMKVDNIHLADVVIALRNAGHKIDVKTGLLDITGKQLRKIEIGLPQNSGTLFQSDLVDI